jgi:hypothetical protein
MKDSLWSMDLFRCESATLRTHWEHQPDQRVGFGIRSVQKSSLLLSHNITISEVSSAIESSQTLTFPRNPACK